MGIFSRFKRAVKANLNDMISRAENPEKMLNQLIQEMNEQLIQAKKQVAQAIADEKKLEREIRRNKAAAEDWEQKAVLAVKAGKDDLAKEALVRQKEYNDYNVQYRSEWEAQHSTVEKLKESLRQLQVKIDEAQRKKNLLIARAKRAEAQKKIQETMGSIADTSAFDAFDRMSHRVEQLEMEAEAAEELGQIGEASKEDNSIEKQFEELEASDSSADKMLEELKKKILKLEDKPS
ncbi:MAG: PspA/IM30 family protein [Spirochaetes bacterium]|nr:MAG: PspA/IM30 family protein [Spirochaetota bacterium]